MPTIRSTHRTMASLALALAAAGGLALAGCADTTTTAFCPIDGARVAQATASADAFIRPASVEDVLAWTGGVAVDAAAVAAERRAAPLPIAVSLPPDLGAAGTIDQRKRAFVGIVLPLAMRANETILAEREFVEKAVACNDAGRPLSPAAQARLDRLAADYEAEDDLRRLRARLDMVPPSLLLAQAAIESGWGTSRFALEGNALFGQRTTIADRGMRPQGLDDAAAVHVAAFPHLLASVRSYVRNLNTQPAYRDFRRQRAALREQGRLPGGLDLAATLTAYSERGAAYVRDLRAIITGNRFDVFDGVGPVAAATGASDA